MINKDCKRVRKINQLSFIDICQFMVSGLDELVSNLCDNQLGDETKFLSLQSTKVYIHMDSYSYYVHIDNWEKFEETSCNQKMHLKRSLTWSISAIKTKKMNNNSVWNCYHTRLTCHLSRTRCFTFSRCFTVTVWDVFEQGIEKQYKLHKTRNSMADLDKDSFRKMWTWKKRKDCVICVDDFSFELLQGKHNPLMLEVVSLKWWNYIPRQTTRIWKANPILMKGAYFFNTQKAATFMDGQWSKNCLQIA